MFADIFGYFYRGFRNIKVKTGDYLREKRFGATQRIGFMYNNNVKIIAPDSSRHNRIIHRMSNGKMG